MKKRFRLISLFLSLIMLVSSFVGCGGATSEKTTEEQGVESTAAVSEGHTSEETTEAEFKPDVEQKNYGEDFYVSVMTDVNGLAHYWVKESENEIMSDAVYARQENIRRYLGVEMYGSGTEAESRYIEPFKTAVKNKDDSVHLLITHTYYGIDGFITGNYVLDFNDVPEINLEAPYWKLDFMEDVGINGRLFLGFSDYSLLSSQVITFNKELLEKYSDQLDESLYSMVYNYRWTLDKMIWLASLAYIDTNADGKTPDDSFGLTGYQSVPFVGFMQACDIKVVDLDESGNYVVGFYMENTKQKMSDLVDKMYALTRSEYACINDKFDYPGLTSGRVLMQFERTGPLINFVAADIDFGILPYPMYNELQKDVGYRSLNWSGYQVIPSYLENPEMVGDTIEMLAYFSKDVSVAYYEKLLGKKVADAPDDRNMLDIVWDGICSDMGQTFFSVIIGTNALYVLPNLTKEGTTQNLASYVAMHQNTINRNFKKFMAHFK